MNTNTEQEIFIPCECGGEVLRLIESKDQIDSKFDSEPVFFQQYYLAMYKHGFVRKPSLWQRIKFCFKYLRTGEMYADEVILSAEQIAKVREFIDQSLVK